MYKYRVQVKDVEADIESDAAYPIAVYNMLCRVRKLGFMFGKLPAKWSATLWTGSVKDEHWRYQVFSGIFLDGDPIINEIKNHIE